MEIISRSEAHTRGLKFYFTGEPCAKGHVAQRYVADGRVGRCVECFPIKEPAPRKHKSKKPKVKPALKVDVAPALEAQPRDPFWRDYGHRISQARIDACIDRIYGGAPRLGSARLSESEAA